MIYENKCKDGKTITSETRVGSLNEIQTLHDDVGHSISMERLHD